MLIRIALLGIVGLVAACAASSPEDAALAPKARIGGIDWYVDYEAAVEIARAQDKALWVHFGENPG